MSVGSLMVISMTDKLSTHIHVDEKISCHRYAIHQGMDKLIHKIRNYCFD